MHVNQCGPSAPPPPLPEPTPAEVRDAQRALNLARGGSVVSESGVLDADTRAALRAFQSEVGLPTTGELDPATTDALLARAAQAEEAPAEEPAPAPAPPRDDTLQNVLAESLLWVTPFGEGVIAGRLAQRLMARGDMPSLAYARRELGSPEAAAQAFEAQAALLFDVNRWDTISGFENAAFKLFDAEGHPVDRDHAQPGDFVRIDLPGPLGYDWVRIESASVTDTRAEIVVRPSYDPTAEPLQPDVIAHFFTDEAVNTFSVERSGTTITAEVRGEHESANVGAEAGSGVEGEVAAIRNRAVAQGAWGPQMPLGNGRQLNGMQQHQWNRFTENLAAVGGDR
jgi:hypothetical protein